MNVFVLGTGRCGSSTTAKVLHTRLNVPMGQRFKKPDENNPDGTFEDLDFVEANRAVLNGFINFPDWLSIVSKRSEERSGSWGLKDPRLCYLLPYYLALRPDARLIVCRRNSETVVSSWLRCYGGIKETIETEIERRKIFLGAFLKDRNFITLDFNEPRSEDWIEEQLVV